MKRHLTPLFAMAVIVLTSLSECVNPFDTDIDSPVYAEINGVPYSSPGHKGMSTYEWPHYTGKWFQLGRHLHSPNGETVHLLIRIARDTLITGIKYNISNPNEFSIGSCTAKDGWIEFTDIDKNSGCVSGKFDFVAESPNTGYIYKITNGIFSVRHLDNY